MNIIFFIQYKFLAPEDHVLSYKVDLLKNIENLRFKILTYSNNNTGELLVTFPIFLDVGFTFSLLILCMIALDFF